MKKGFKLTSAAVIALSAVTPVAVSANTAASVQDGYYIGDKFYTGEQISKLSTAEIKQLIKAGFKAGKFVVVRDGKVYDFEREEVYRATKDTDLDSLGQSYEDFTKTGKTLSENGVGTTTPGETLKVESVSAITETGKDATIYTNVDDDKTVKVVASSENAEGNAVEGVTYSFESSNTNVATVAEDGTVTAVADGVARITVKTTNATEVKSAFVDVTVDTVLKVTKVEAVANNVLKVDFSTPLANNAELNTNYTVYKQDFSTIGISKAEFVSGSNKKSVYLTLDSNVALNTDYTLRLANVQDADNQVIATANQNNPFKTGAAFDTTKPALTGNPEATSSQTVVLNLTKPVKDTGVAKNTAAYTLKKKSDGSVVNVSKVEFVNNQQVKLTLASKLVNNIDYTLDIAADTLEDYVGNKNAATATTFVGFSDTVAPSLSAVKVTGTQSVEFEFNKDVDEDVRNYTTAPKVAVFDVTNGETYLGTVTDGGGATVGTNIAQSDETGHTTDKKFLEADLSTASPAVTLAAGKSYKFVVSGIQNLDGKAAGELTKTIEIPAVNLQGAEKEAGQNKKAILTFDKDVNVNTGDYVVTVYTIENGEIKSTEVLTNTGLDAAGLNAKQLRVTSANNFDAGKTYRVTINKVENGQNLDYVKLQSAEFTVADTSTKPVLESATQVVNSGNKLELAFNTEIAASQTFDYDLFKAGSSIPVDTGRGETSDLVKSAVDGKKATLELNAGVTLEDGVNYTLKLKGIVAQGQASSVEGFQTVTFTGKDYVDPTVSAIELVDANTVTLKFDEKVDISGVTSFEVLAPKDTWDDAWVAATPTLGVDGKTVTLKTAKPIATGFAASNANVRISGVIKDKSAQANELTASEFATDLGSATATDNAKPVAIKSYIDNGDKDVINVLFSEELNAAPANAGWTLNGFTGYAFDAAASLASDESIVQLDLDGDINTIALDQSALSLQFTGTDAVDKAQNLAADAFYNLKVTENVKPGAGTVTAVATTGKADGDVQTGDTITLTLDEQILTSTLTASDITITLDDDSTSNGDATVLTGSDLTLSWTNDNTVVITIAKTGVNVALDGTNDSATLDIAAGTFEDKNNNTNAGITGKAISGFQTPAGP